MKNYTRVSGIFLVILALLAATVPYLVGAWPAAAQDEEYESFSGELAEQLAEILQQKLNLTPEQRKIDFNILKVVQEAEERVAEISGGEEVNLQNLSTSLLKVDGKGDIEVKIMVTRLRDDEVDQLEDLGMIIKIALPEYDVVEGKLPYDRVEEIAELDFVIHVGPPGYPVYNTGDVTSAGDTVLRAAEARTAFGVDGSGLKIGVMSDGVTHLANSVASGDLPSSPAVDVVQAGSGDEGTAMLEIIHDLAPGAELAFYSPSSDTDMVVGIGELADAGCDIIVDDITFLNEPKFEDGPIAQEARQFVDDGGVYVTSAGNSAERHYIHEYDQDGEITVTIGGDNYSYYAHDYGSGDIGNTFTVPDGGYIRVPLHWNNEWGSAADDFDFFLVSGSTILDYSWYRQQGGAVPYPFEYLSWENTTGSSVSVFITILEWSLVSDPSSLMLDYTVYNNYNPTLEYYMPGNSVIGHSAVEEVLSTAAAYSGTPSTIEDFSSRGPGTIYFPSYEERQVPNITGVDGVQTKTGQLGYFSNPFYGTSASAPHLAAIAALVWEANPTLTPSEVTTAITSTAVDEGTSGYDYTWGYGLVDAYEAVASVSGTPTEVTSVDPASGHQGQTLDDTITGTSFTGATGVSFGAGITVNDFSVDSDTQITADITIAGGAATGTRDVSVTTPAGTGTLTAGFTVNANTAPVLSDGGVSPASGDVTTEFTYSVTYTDADDDAPALITVSIDGGAAQAMTVKTGEDGDYTNGEVYEYKISGLEKDASHTFEFAASDGTDTATGDTTSHDGPTVSNSAPVLSDGGVSPTSGDVTTEFTYSVTYTDADDDAPASITVSVDGGAAQAMTVKTGEDGDYTNGEVYEYKVSGLEKGTSHTYQFAAGDGTAAATGDTTSHDGPTVANSAPVLSDGGVSPASGDVTTEFTYSVTYTDADDDEPDSITVSIDGGAAQAMTVKTGEDGDYTNGEVYEYKVSGLSPGSHTYQFAAGDGTAAATGDTASHDGPGVANNAPALSDGMVAPSSGYVTTEFTYSVTYTDADDDEPDSITVSIDGGAEQAMTVKTGEDGDYTNGEVYEYKVSGLEKDASHTYQFAAGDGMDTATGDTASHDGPTVDNSPPSITGVIISPAPAYTDDDLTATPSGWDDADGDSPGYQWQWQKDSGSGFEIIAGADTNTLASTNFVRDDRIKVICTPDDGTDTGTPQEDTITIANTPPGAPVVDVTPDVPSTGDDLECGIVTGSDDADGDGVTYSYAWYRNEVLQESLTGATVSSTNTADGDVWKCVVTPNDGTDDGATGEDEVTIGVPVLSEGAVAPETGYTTDEFTYAVVYTDGDNTLPVSIQVIIDEDTASPVDMTEADAGDTDCTDGKAYQCVVDGKTLDKGDHQFRFTASDGTHDAIGDTDIHDGPTVKKRGGGGGGGGGSDETPPTISKVSPSDVTKVSVNIYWKTQEVSTSQVEYWASPHQFSELDETLVVDHNVQLTGLNPATTYYYQTMSQDVAGNLAVSEVFSFTTLGEPANFVLGDLTVTPETVAVGEKVSISVLVSNTGEASGEYPVILKLDGTAAAAEVVALAGGDSQTVTFTTSRDTAGSYQAGIGDLACSFEVTAPTPTLTPAFQPDVTQPTPATTADAGGMDWVLIGGIIAAVVIIGGLLTFFLVRRRRA